MFKFALLFLLGLSASPAYAGKLAEGVFGTPWGTHETFPKPGEVCTHQPEPTIEWACNREIAGVPVTVHYAWKYKLFYAVMIRGTGFEGCNTLMNTLTAAWGASRPKSQYLNGALDDRVWQDLTASASWDYNKISGVCSVAVVSLSSYSAVQHLDKESVKSAAEGI
jgi:hypothetical protein